jgi:hypothetical protein
MYVKRGGMMIENAKTSKLLAMFNTLQEADKDLVIEMSESLVQRRDLDKPVVTVNDNVGEKNKRLDRNRGDENTSGIHPGYVTGFGICEG